MESVKPIQHIPDVEHWYAARALHQKTATLMQQAKECGYHIYYPVRTVELMSGGTILYEQQPFMENLFFIRCTLTQIKDFRFKNNQDIIIYRDRNQQDPAPIRDKDMDMFILITSVQDNQSNLECLPSRPEYAQGDLVRVTKGVYAGAEGIVRRIRKDRKLLVAISGVAVIAVSNIPLNYLEKIQQS